MFYSSLLACAAVASCAGAQTTNIYLSAYGDMLYSLGYSEQDGVGSLSLIDKNTGCAPSPAWVEFDSQERVLYCLDEGILRDNGSVSSYQVSTDGFLTLAERRVFPSGPSAGVLYGSANNRTLAVSHYNGSALSLWDIDSQGLLVEKAERFFYQNFVGPNPRQTAPHEHDVILDPTGRFLILTAHGQDQLQTFAIDAATGALTQMPSFNVTKGSGPRHGVFWSPDGASTTTNLYFFLLSEITSTLTTYNATYANGTINFEEVDVTNSYGGAKVPEYNGPAELAVSPDNRFLVLTNRNSTVVHASLPGGTNIIPEYWDNLASFTIHPNGSLALQEIVPAGCSWPRSLAFNRPGDRVAVACQGYNRVVIFERNITSGMFGSILANMTVEGQPTCVVWDD